MELIGIIASFICLMVGVYEGVFKQDYAKGSFFVLISMLNPVK